MTQQAELNPQLPSGLLTFLMTDVESYSILYEDHEEEMQQIVPRHNQIAKEIIEAYSGHLIKKQGEGDSIFAVFTSAANAMAAACNLQIAFSSEKWPDPIELKVRIALDTGESQPIEGDYTGPIVNRCARLRAIANGGQVLFSASTWEYVQFSLPDGAESEYRGEYTLKNIRANCRVYELLHPRYPKINRPLRSISINVGHIPSARTSFIGRRKEIQKLEDLLEHERLITLKGLGGCGKTRLSQECARRVQDRYSDGVWFISLAEAKNFDDVLLSIHEQLRLQERPGLPLKAQINDHLKSRILLIILDNCEQVRQATAELVEQLLENCPQLRILTTTREGLGIRGEYVFEVPPLSLPPEKPGSRKAIQSEAMDLFIERIKDRRERTKLTEAERDAIARICRSVDGLPFAIELAAARVGDATILELSQDLFELLEQEEFSTLRVNKHHQTLEQMIEWSLNLLPNPADALLLKRMAIFAGSFDRNAVDAICIDEPSNSKQTLASLTRLRRASLLEREDSEQITRYYLRHILREHGRKNLLYTQEGKVTINRFISYYTNLIEEAEPHLTGQNQIKYLDRLEQENENLRQALNLATNPDEKMRIVASIWRYWLIHCHFTEGKLRCEEALSNSAEEDSLLRAKALLGTGIIVTRQNDYVNAQGSLEESLRIFTLFGDNANMGAALNNLGNVHREKGDLEKAVEYYAAARDASTQGGDKRGEAAALTNLGIVYREKKELDTALKYFQQALELWRTIHDLLGLASNLTNLGMIQYDLEDYLGAKKLFEESIEQYRKLGNSWAEAMALNNLASCYAKLDVDGNKAYELCRNSISLFNSLGDKRTLIYPLLAITSIAFSRNSFDLVAQISAVIHLITNETSITLPSLYLEGYNNYLTTARTEMGETRYGIAWEVGITRGVEGILKALDEYMNVA